MKLTPQFTEYVADEIENFKSKNKLKFIGRSAETELHNTSKSFNDILNAIPTNDISEVNTAYIVNFLKRNKDKYFEEENIVKSTCQELGITQKELAERIGVTPSAISQWGSEIPKTAQVALELMIENNTLKKDLQAIIKGHEVLTRLAVQNLDS